MNYFILISAFLFVLLLICCFVLIKKCKGKNLVVDGGLSHTTFDAVNAYRENLGLPILLFDINAKLEADKHSLYMANVGSISHDKFGQRSDLLKSIGAVKVSENIAHNCRTAGEAVYRWDDSIYYKANMQDASFTHTAVSVVRDKEGIPYTTQIFIKNKTHEVI